MAPTAPAPTLLICKTTSYSKKRPGDFALSCNPSNCNWEAEQWDSLKRNDLRRHRIDFHVLTKAGYQLQVVRGAWKSARRINYSLKILL
jgi:hypothetical protein